MVAYYAEIMAARTGMPARDAYEIVNDPIRQELRMAAEHGLAAFEPSMGQMMLGTQEPPNKAVAGYIAFVREREWPRWLREGVTKQDVVWWWDLGAVVHGCWVVLDTLVCSAQFLGAMRSRPFDSVEEAAGFSAAHVKKWCAIYGDASYDDGTPGGRLPLELRSRVESWSSRMIQEQPTTHIYQIQESGNFNALCRTKIAKGEI